MENMKSLILTRKYAETIVLRPKNGEEIRITAHRIRGSHVALRFQAPASVRIIREELLEPDDCMSANGDATDG